MYNANFTKLTFPNKSNGKTKLVDGLTKPQSVDKFHGNPFPVPLVVRGGQNGEHFEEYLLFDTEKFLKFHVILEKSTVPTFHNNAHVQ